MKLYRYLKEEKESKKDDVVKALEMEEPKKGSTVTLERVEETLKMIEKAIKIQEKKVDKASDDEKEWKEAMLLDLQEKFQRWTEIHEKITAPPEEEEPEEEEPEEGAPEEAPKKKPEEEKEPPFPPKKPEEKKPEEKK